MERYWDLTEKQRSELTREQVESFLTVELMENGVTKVEPLVLETPTPVELATDTYYQVEGDEYTHFNAIFRTMEQAQAFVELKPMASDYDYNAGIKNTYLKPCSGYKIGTVKLCRREDIANSRAVLQKNEAIAKANEKATQAYNEACKLVERASAHIFDDWDDCCEKSRSFAKVLATFNEYVGICDGDRFKALVFLCKAFDRTVVDAAREWFGDDSIPFADCQAVPVECVAAEPADRF